MSLLCAGYRIWQPYVSLPSSWWMVIFTDWVFPHDNHSFEESAFRRNLQYRSFDERYAWMVFPQWDCMGWWCSPLSVDPGSAISMTLGATLCQGVWWLARAFSCNTEITWSRSWYIHMTMDQQFPWQYESYWCIYLGFLLVSARVSRILNCWDFTIPEPLRGRVMYGNTPCDIGQGFGIAADTCYMFTYLWTRQGSLPIFTKQSYFATSL